MLRPAVRLMIARGLPFPELGEILKELYVDACRRYFQLGEKRLTDSRVSVLTGLQRKDIRAIRARLESSGTETASPGAGPVPRVIALWLNQRPFLGKGGLPRILHRTEDGGHPSFEELVAEVSRDVHPRTVLDELKRQGLIAHNLETDEISLETQAFVPSRDEEALLGYFGANLGDHAEAASANLSAAPEPGPYFERAVHYNKLTPEALEQLETLARDLQSEALAKLNTQALALQKRDKGNAAAIGRFRCGAFIYTADRDTEEADA